MHHPRVLVAALAAGAVVGVAARMVPALAVAVAALQPLASLWVRALQMTLVPLIFAMVASGVGAAAAAGRGGRMLALVMAINITGSLAAVAVCLALTEATLALWPLPPHPLAGLLAAAPPPPALPGIAAQLLAIVPENPVAAAARGEILPLVIFALVFGLAIARQPAPSPGAPPHLVAVTAGLAHAMMTIVEWVLLTAPLAIPLLVAGVVAGTGVAVADLLAHYVALNILGALALVACCYVAVAATRAHPLRRFAAGILPAQVMAMGTCSSMATTPLMLEVALDDLQVPEPVAAAVVPLAVSSFRMATAGLAAVDAVLGCHAFGLHPGPLALAMAALAVVLSGLGTPGLPANAILYATDAPAMSVLGVPLSIIPLWMTVASIPDPFITAANVTGQLSLTAIVARFVRLRGAPIPDALPTVVAPA